MTAKEARWYQMNNDERIVEIRLRRANNESFAKIAEELLGDEKNKSTIWSWAKRNMQDEDLYPRMQSLPSQPYSEFSSVEQWYMYDIMSSLFPRLDAITQHILFEIQKILTEQQKKFSLTASFLDDLEERVIKTIEQYSATLGPRMSVPVPPGKVSASPPPPVPRATGAPPPPPVSGSGIHSRVGIPSGSMAELRTDFEEMSMEEITALPPDFLEALTPTDRNRVQERVKELRMLEKMSEEEREEYLRLKQEEKERVEASEGLGGSLTAMLDDQDSLFARMRRAADDSQVSGTGTFGKFLTEYIYFYCFSCGKMNRSEGDELEMCEYCRAGPELMVLDEEKTNYRYWECISEKNREPVNPQYTRGHQIVVRSRWKTPFDQELDVGDCPSEKVREITSAVAIKSDPDKQFSHYIILFRLYSQLNLQGDLKTYISELGEAIQTLPDIITKEQANIQALSILDKIIFLLDWIESRKFIESHPNSKEIIKQVNNLRLDIKALSNPESPQELRKASEVGQISSKVDQILNRFSNIFLQLESELLVPSKWKCSSCENEFEVKDRLSIPEKCVSCGKIITKLLPVD